MLQGLPPPEIVVTAPALPDPAAERAYSVDAIGRDALLNAPSVQLEEILEQVPGLQLFRRSDARSGHPTSQGVTLRALGGNASSRALLVLDGVPQTDPFGGWVNWPAFNAAALDEVRVVRGGGSVGHGPGALAGVIEMSSLSERNLFAGASLGSRDSIAADAYAGLPLGQGLLGVSGNFARGDGFIPVIERQRGPIDRSAGYEAAGVRAQWLAPISVDVSVQATGAAFVDERERGEPFTGNRTRGADASLRLVGSGQWQWSVLGYGQWRELRSSFSSVDDTRTEARRVALQDAVPSRAYGAAVEVRPPLGSGLEARVGADTRLTRGESRELYFFVDGDPTRGRVAGGETATAGAFAELTASLGKLTLSGGARLDYWRVSDGSLRERTLASGATLRQEIYPARDGWLPTGRAGAVLDLGGGASLRSAAYLGWRMPTLNELFRPFRVGDDTTNANALLDPERLAGIEAGADYARGGIELSVTLFANRLRDAIANVTLSQLPGGGQLRQRRNLDAVRVAGIEASAEARRGPWSLRAGGSYVDAEVDGNGLAAPLDGLRPAQTPKLTLTGAVGWQRGARALTLQLRHVGSQFEDDLNAIRLPPATTVDAFAAWPLARKLQLIFRGENLLDERVVAGIGSDGIIERATPRTLWIGLRFDADSKF